ncbi:hypothetical protein BHM03_00024828 [Ensete ventricosum]|nr:hypothetical protein BHM03_00024828 [Ensete ventricosum]
MLVIGHVLQLGDQYRSNDDGEPSGTAGKPIYSAIVSSGLDMVMVVVIRYSFCSCFLVSMGLLYFKPSLSCSNGLSQLQHFEAEDIKEDYDTGKEGVTMVTFRVEYDKIESLEDAINSACSRKVEFYKR